MSEVSLLMAGVLIGNQASLPDQFPAQSPIESDTVEHNSTQESYQQFPHAHITPPEFLEVDLEKRYGCVDYSGKIDAENFAITHDEFATGLEVCLLEIDELFTNNLEPEDLILLQRLQHEVKRELAQL